MKTANLFNALVVTSFFNVSFVSCLVRSSQTHQSPGRSATTLQSSSPVATEDWRAEKSSLPKKSQAIPFLVRPPALKGQYAGDVGFDPLNFATNEEILEQYREAEIKHARLAMLAAVGWPLAEIFDRQIASYFHLDSVLDNSDRVPSLLNGGLDKISPEFWGFCLGLTAAIDLYGVQRSRSPDRPVDWFPGDLSFDPLRLYPGDVEGRQRLQLAEIKHGRLAMLGVTGFAFQEWASKEGVIDETPFFFYPITQSLSKLFE